MHVLIHENIRAVPAGIPGGKPARWPPAGVTACDGGRPAAGPITASRGRVSPVALRPGGGVPRCGV